MIRRAQRAGIDAEYLLADAWFGTKAMMQMTEKQLLTPILRMKKSKMKLSVDQIQGRGKYLPGNGCKSAVSVLYSRPVAKNCRATVSGKGAEC